MPPLGKKHGPRGASSSSVAPIPSTHPPLPKIKEQLKDQTNILPQDQMLVDANTGIEVPEDMAIQELLAAGASHVTLHLLTDNSAA